MSDADQIKADIELTRAELARTVDALHAKLDVKALARQRLHETTERMSTLARDNQRALLVAAGAAFALLALRARRHRRT